MEYILADKVIVITGGTKGVGRALAVAAAGQGANVVIGGRSEQDGQAIVEEIHTTYHREALFVRGDITKVEECRHLMAQAESKFACIHGLVNYAGILPAASLLETEESLFDDVFNLNIKAAFFCTKFAVQSMLRGGRGSVINMGSTHGYGGDEDRAAYACSKGALLNLTKHIARNYATYQIRANWVTMGWVPTPGEVSFRKTQGQDMAWLEEQAREHIPMGRLQTPEDHTFGMLYLLSDLASQVTGTELFVTGGRFPTI